MTVIAFFIVYFVIMNIMGFAVMGIDKKKSIRHEWRISEKALFAVCLLGGSLGSTIGMFHFHHKTKHWYFRYGFPIILGAHIILAAYLIGSANIKIM